LQTCQSNSFQEWKLGNCA